MKKTKIEVCKTEIFDREKVEKVRRMLPGSKDISELSETFKVLSDPTRLKIVLALSMEEMCAWDWPNHRASNRSSKSAFPAAATGRTSKLKNGFGGWIDILPKI